MLRRFYGPQNSRFFNQLVLRSEILKNRAFYVRNPFDFLSLPFFNLLGCKIDFKIYTIKSRLFVFVDVTFMILYLVLHLLILKSIFEFVDLRP